MPRQSYLHFECEAMSVMQYRTPNASNRISADIPHWWQVTWIVLRALMGVLRCGRNSLTRIQYDWNATDSGSGY
jgi:hypothetical protein